MKAPHQAWLLLAVLAIGIALRLVQYLSGTSLWLDEVALVKGILGRDLQALLTQPLPFFQVAPGGFLLAQKTAVLALGPVDWVLRIVPFISSVVALVFFASFARRALTPVAAGIATLLFATAAPFVIFAGAVKQYSTDVCIAVLLSWLALDVLTQPVTRGRAWSIAIAGALLQWCSQPAVFVAAGLAVPLMLASVRASHDIRRRYVGVVAAWGASAIGVAAWSLLTTSVETRDYMRVYWADGLAPLTLADWWRTGWPWPGIHRLFRGGFGAQAGLAYPLSPLFVVLAIAGFVSLWRRNRRVALLTLAPVVVTLAAGLARQYPFRDRLILFLLPGVFAAIGEGCRALLSAMMPMSRRIAVATVAAICILAVWPVATKLPPYRVEDVKQVLRYVQSKRQSDDHVYVYYAAAPVMSLYDSAFGFTAGTYAVGGCHRGAESRQYLEELDTFRGSARVWVILTHSLPAYREREDIVAYLDSIGTAKDYIGVPSRAVSGEPLPAEAFLYDLTPTPRSAVVNSASFQITGPTSANQQHLCANGPHAMIPSDFVCGSSPGARCSRRSRPTSASSPPENLNLPR